MDRDVALSIFEKYLVTKTDYVSLKKLKFYTASNKAESDRLLEWVHKNYPGLTIAQSYRLLRSGILSPLICKNPGCKNTVTTNNRANVGNSQFSFYCGNRCGNASKDRIEKILTTKTERYGGNGFATESHRRRACATMKEKYGVSWYTEHPDFWNKAEKTSLDRYGTRHPFQSEQVQTKHRKVMQERYGIDTALDAGSEFRKKMYETVESRYGDPQIMRTSYLRSLKESQGLRIPDVERTAYEIYHREVWNITRTNINKVPNLSLRGRLDQKTDAYHLDHRFSIYEGFKNTVPPEIIGSEHNLEMIPARRNCGKGKRCSMTLEHLLSLYHDLS